MMAGKYVSISEVNNKIKEAEAARGVAPYPAPPRRPGQQRQIVIQDIETEGDRQLKVLLKRQLDTSGNIQDQIAKKKSFTEPALYKPLNEEVSGSHTLQEFIDKEKQNESLDELQQYGLTAQEIEMYRQAQSNKNCPARGGFGLNPEAYNAQLEAIHKKIASRKEMLLQPIQFSGAKPMTRHEMELEKSISHGVDKSRTLSSLTVEKGPVDPSWNDTRHPINHLDAILEEAIEKRRQQQAENGQFAVATCAPRPDDYESNSTDIIKDNGDNHNNSDCSKSTMTEDNAKTESDSRTSDAGTVESLKDDTNSKIKTPESVKDEDGRNILQGNVTPIPKEVILKYKLSVEEIKKLDKFKNYSPGPSNKVLYLKNLSSKVTESDLVSLFLPFQDPECPALVYRLMTGRMSGQAFVTFHSEAAATEALELVNGYHFKGKPIIIQFGRKT